METNCPCPRNGCVKTAVYLEREGHLENWDGRACPNCGNPITNRHHGVCPCITQYCPCMKRDLEREHARVRESCPCVIAKCDCLK